MHVALCSNDLYIETTKTSRVSSAETQAPHQVHHSFQMWLSHVTYSVRFEGPRPRLRLRRKLQSSHPGQVPEVTCLHWFMSYFGVSWRIVNMSCMLYMSYTLQRYDACAYKSHDASTAASCTLDSVRRTSWSWNQSNLESTSPLRTAKAVYQTCPNEDKSMDATHTATVSAAFDATKKSCSRQNVSSVRVAIFKAGTW